MIKFLAKRFAAMIAVLFGSTYIIYLLIAYSGDPLTDIRLAGEDNQDYLLEQATKDLHLDVPPYLRYFLWLRGVLGVFIGQVDFGLTRSSNPVVDVLGPVIPTTIRLVLLATILAIIIGVTIGLVSAIRQYSRFDYTVTFISFLFYSLPIFWLAFLLKEFAAIGFNDFLADPIISVPVAIGIGLGSGLFWASIIGGDRKRFWLIFAGASASGTTLLLVLSAIGWFTVPQIGPIFILALGIGFAFVSASIFAGKSSKPLLKASLAQAGIGLIAYFVAQPLFNQDWNELKSLAFILVLLALALISGRLLGGNNPKPAMKAAALTSVLTASLILIDRLMQAWDDYFNNEWISGRPIATVGEATTDLTGDFWLLQMDGVTHLALPTAALMAISVATYVRYSRASQLEVMNQDYIRTARAKGLPENIVVLRHALKNSLIPLTTVMALDFAGVVGGAIITERVFGWRGMGTIFTEALIAVDLNLAMGVVLMTTTSALIFNLVADLVYSALDPRIRVR